MIRRGLRLGLKLILGGGIIAAPGVAIAQTLAQGQSADISWWRIGASLALCLALAVAGAFALRMKMRGGGLPVFTGGARRMQLLETIRLAHQVELCLLRCDDQDVVISVSPHGAFVVTGLDLSKRKETSR